MKTESFSGSKDKLHHGKRIQKRKELGEKLVRLKNGNSISFMKPIHIMQKQPKPNGFSMVADGYQRKSLLIG